MRVHACARTDLRVSTRVLSDQRTESRKLFETRVKVTIPSSRDTLPRTRSWRCALHRSRIERRIEIFAFVEITFCSFRRSRVLVSGHASQLEIRRRRFSTSQKSIAFHSGKVNAIARSDTQSRSTNCLETRDHDRQFVAKRRLNRLPYTLAER